MNRRGRVFLRGVLVLALAGALGAFLFFRARNRPEPLPGYNQLPDFELTTEEGYTLTLQDLAGSVWIADFIFTRCGGPCPVMSEHMAELQQRLADTGIRLVSFTVDPEYDTPEVLMRYASRYKADPGMWFFLTGNKAVIHNFSIQSFMLGVSSLTEEERKNQQHDIGHSTKFTLVDRKGVVRGYYDGLHVENLDKLVRDAVRLSKEKSGS